MKKLLFLCMSFLIVQVAQAQIPKTINSLTAGTLSTLLTDNEKSTVTNLTVTGNIDGRDFLILKNNLSALVWLDLSNASISEYSKTEFSGGYSYTTFYAANTVPELKQALTTVLLPKTATAINGNAFYNSSIRAIIIPKSMKDIKTSAFQGCKNLSSLIIENASVNIWSSTFNACPMLSEVNLGDSIISIGDYSFAGCSSLEAVKLPKSLKSTGSNAFSNCTKLKKADILSSNEIGAYMFSDCTSLTDVTISNSTKKINDYVFKNCTSLAKCIIPNSVSTLNSYVFYNCTGLKKINIPSAVTTINCAVFGYCTGLDTVVNSSYIPYSSYSDCSMFYSVDVSKCVLQVPYKTKSKYLLSTQWKDFGKIIENEKGVNIDKLNYYSSEKSGDTLQIKINSNDAWTVSCNRPWVSISQVNGINDAKLIITVSGNDSITSRNATITVYDSNATPQKISLTQHGKQVSVASTSGSFSNSISANDKLLVDNLKLTGEIDARDLRSIQTDLPKLTSLNLSDVKITAFKGSYGTNYYNNCNYLKNEIPIQAFSDKLVSIKLPSRLSTIDCEGFSGCAGLKDVYVNLQNPIDLSYSCSANVFNSIDTSNCVLHVPSNTKNLYTQSKYWKNFKHIIEAQNYLFVNTDTVLVNSKSGNTVGIKVNSNVNWTLESDQQWLSFRANSGSGNDSIFIIAQPNPGFTPRIANVKILSTNAEIEFFTVAQSGSLASVNIVAGGLYAALTPEIRKNVTNLSVSGTIDARDFRILRDSLPKIIELNLSAANIVAYKGTDGTLAYSSTNYLANEIPIYAFFDYNNTSKGKASLKSIIFPSTLTSIGEYSFKSCIGLTNIDLSGSITTIKNDAFYGCTGLSKVIIPGNLKTLGAYLFSDCTNLKEVEIQAPISKLGGSTFLYCSNLRKVTLPTTFAELSDNLFDFCTNLDNIEIPVSVTKIGTLVFRECRNLRTIKIPNSVQKMGTANFLNCTILDNVVLSNSLDKIEESSFKDCAGLKNIEIPNSIKNIGNSAFENCKSLSTIVLPKSLKIIGMNSFQQSGLVNVEIPDSVISIEGSAFSSCYKIKSMKLSANLERIDYFAFDNCNLLTTITIPNSVNFIGDDAFQSCSSLSSIYSETSLPVALGANTNVFNNVNTSTCVLYVNYKTKALYAIADQWKNFPNIVENSAGLYINSNTANLSATEGSSKQISVSSTSKWTVRSDKSWVNVIPVFDAGNESVTITADANLNIVKRTARVIITLESGAIHLIRVNQNAALKVVNITAGGLLSSMTTIERKSVCKLRITGSIDARDFKIMRDSMPMLEDLDIEQVTIAGFSGWSGGTDEWRSYNTPYYAATIPAYAFQYKSTLKSIILPASLKQIEKYSFDNCANLIAIKGLSSTPIVLSSSYSYFYGVNKSACVLNVPIGSKLLYLAAYEWKDFLNIVELTTGLSNVQISLVNIYPNPVNNEFRVTGFNGLATISIVDLNGKVMLSKQIINTENITVGTLSKGIYIVRIQTNEGTIERKLIRK